jgi:hypothetical protein
MKKLIISVAGGSVVAGVVGYQWINSIIKNDIHELNLKLNQLEDEISTSDKHDLEISKQRLIQQRNSRQSWIDKQNKFAEDYNKQIRYIASKITGNF